MVAQDDGIGDDGIKFTSLRASALAGAWQSLMGCDHPIGILRYAQDDGNNCEKENDIPGFLPAAGMVFRDPTWEVTLWL